VKGLFGPEFSAKDFRTWHATVLAAVGAAVSTRPSSEIGAQAGRLARRLRGRPLPRQHACRLPLVVHRPPRLRSLPPGRHDQATLERLDWAEDDDAPATQGSIEEAVVELLAG
jgi:hypothetical protein